MKPLLLAFALTLFCSPIVPVALAGETATAFGRVVEQRTHEPFEGVVVELSGTSFWTRTDAHGQFELGNLTPGIYQLVVHIPEWGDFSRTVNLKARELKTTEFVVWPGIRTDHEGVLAYYPMDGSADDLGPNGWHGVNKGATATTDRNGRSAAAMHFNGKTQRIEVAHRDRLNELPLSIAFWVKAETDVVDPSMWLGKYLHPDGDGWCVFYEYQRMCAGYFRDAFANSARSHASYKADDQWHHVVVTMDTIGTVIHFDDARVPQVIAYHKTPTPTKNTEPMFIGYLNSRLGTPGLKGSLDEMYVFDHVLSDAEIGELRKK